MKKIASLLIGVLMPLFALSAFAPAFAATSPDIRGGLCAGANLTFTDDPPGTRCSDNGAADSLNNLVKKIIDILSAVVGIVAVVMIIIGGLRYITSGGNDTSVTSAKNTILYAIIGLIVVALAQLIVKFTLSKVSSA